jgi:hypothetical protein
VPDGGFVDTGWTLVRAERSDQSSWTPRRPHRDPVGVTSNAPTPACTFRARSGLTPFARSARLIVVLDGIRAADILLRVCTQASVSGHNARVAQATGSAQVTRIARVLARSVRLISCDRLRVELLSLPGVDLAWTWGDSASTSVDQRCQVATTRADPTITGAFGICQRSQPVSSKRLEDLHTAGGAGSICSPSFVGRTVVILSTISLPVALRPVLGPGFDDEPEQRRVRRISGERTRPVTEPVSNRSSWRVTAGRALPAWSGSPDTVQISARLTRRATRRPHRLTCKRYM